MTSNCNDSFEDWFNALRRYALKQGEGRLISDDAESYMEYYSDGDSPQEAFNQEKKYRQIKQIKQTKPSKNVIVR